MKRHHRWHRLLEQQARIEKGPIAAQADDEVDAILKIVRSIPERLQPISNPLKPGVRGQGWIFQDGCFDENYHPFFFY